MHARTDGQQHGRTTRNHIASASAYRRRRLKNQSTTQRITPAKVQDVFLALPGIYICGKSIYNSLVVLCSKFCIANSKIQFLTHYYYKSRYAYSTYF